METKAQINIPKQDKSSTSIQKEASLTEIKGEYDYLPFFIDYQTKKKAVKMFIPFFIGLIITLCYFLSIEPIEPIESIIESINSQIQNTRAAISAMKDKINSEPLLRAHNTTKPVKLKFKPSPDFDDFFKSKAILIQASVPLKDFYEYQPIQWPELGELYMVNMTAVFTTSGRADLLSSTLQTFFQYNSYPLVKVIVTHDGNLYKGLEDLIKVYPNITWLISNMKVGQMTAIDQAYKLIETEYYFHSQDDWEYEKEGFIEYSVQALMYDPMLNGIHLTHMHLYKIPPFKIGPLRIITELQLPKYSGHSLNPSGHRIQDYRILQGGFSGASLNLSYASGAGVAEQIVSQVYSMKGYHTAMSQVQFCRHSGGKNPSPWKYWLKQGVKQESVMEIFAQLQQQYNEWLKQNNDKDKLIESLVYLLQDYQGHFDDQSLEQLKRHNHNHP